MVLKAKCLLKVVICSYILWGSETGLYKAPETFHYAAAQWESLSGRVTAQECVGTGRDGQRQSSTAESGGRRTSTVLSHVPLRIRVFLAHPWTISEQVVCYAARPTCWTLHTTAFSSPEKYTGKKSSVSSRHTFTISTPASNKQKWASELCTQPRDHTLNPFPVRFWILRSHFWLLKLFIASALVYDLPDLLAHVSIHSPKTKEGDAWGNQVYRVSSCKCTAQKL